jgi:hypothetical protein
VKDWIEFKVELFVDLLASDETFSKINKILKAMDEFKIVAKLNGISTVLRGEGSVKPPFESKYHPLEVFSFDLKGKFFRATEQEHSDFVDLMYELEKHAYGLGVGRIVWDEEWATITIVPGVQAIKKCEDARIQKCFEAIAEHTIYKNLADHERMAVVRRLSEDEKSIKRITERLK